MTSGSNPETSENSPTGISPNLLTFCPECPLLEGIPEEERADPLSYRVTLLPDFSHEANDPRYPDDRDAILIGQVSSKNGASKYLLLGASGDESLETLADEAAYATHRCQKPIVIEPGKIARLFRMPTISKCGAGIIKASGLRRPSMREANYTIR